MMLWFINTHTIYTSKGRGLFPAFFVVHGAMTQVEYVLFDCDGVLVDSEALTQSVLQQSFARYGLQIETPEIAGLFVGGTMRGAMMTARSRGAALPEDWLDQINTELFGVLADHCEVISGVPEMLDQLDRAGIGYGICSNGPLAKMQVTLGRCGLWDRFEGRIFRSKTAPQGPRQAVPLACAVLAIARIWPRQNWPRIVIFCLRTCARFRRCWA
jgi:beta-phosphoglucomutase-like phosphatase (HAD superfamily)